MPEISQHSYDIAVVAVRRDHTSGVSALKVYRPCLYLFLKFARQLGHWKLVGNRRAFFECVVIISKQSSKRS